MANSRTNNAAYDKLYAEMFAPIFNREAAKLLNNKEFLKMTLGEQRDVVEEKKRDIKAQMNVLMRDFGSPNTQKQYKLARIRNKGTAEQKRKARAFVEERGAEGPMAEWTMKQLEMYEQYIALDREF